MEIEKIKINSRYHRLAKLAFRYPDNEAQQVKDWLALIVKGYEAFIGQDEFLYLVQNVDKLPEKYHFIVDDFVANYTCASMNDPGEEVPPEEEDE